ncbi:MAG: hypothetical protein UT29_C0002G0019 [Candidatus Yanofskybacteria bacterium GW2011_GWA1_39_13]|uniref:Uncharacterized protein n=1 Tax=Yanofskybacteria sp. (strain GW2011_GWA1_39_13) TaxID=1619019 RepID=A0A0G0QL81_YANXG|nr:MAG: hypothetical protein UT29_C0002G0019 [Candidatus Yanofskybacteria bacterium GW2011_GWA1_39_13]
MLSLAVRFFEGEYSVQLTLGQFQKLLPDICTKETSFDPDRWIPENPLWGHCAVVSLLANDFFGGGFVRAFLDGTPFADVGSHYWNVLPDGTEYDFTKVQFGRTELQLKGKLTKSDGKPIDREYLLKNEETKKRYELLRERFESYLQQAS